MRLDATASGVFVIAPTPFRENGSLDLASVPRMVEFFLARGIEALVILGMMGKAAKVAEEECRLMVREVLSVTAGCVPVIVGVPAISFATMRILADAATDNGAAAEDVADIALSRACLETRPAAASPAAGNP